MSNWWNEVFIEEGWFDSDIDKEETPEHVKIEERTGNHCRICGTRTGLHGFSFDTKAW